MEVGQTSAMGTPVQSIPLPVALPAQQPAALAEPQPGPSGLGQSSLLEALGLSKTSLFSELHGIIRSVVWESLPQQMQMRYVLGRCEN